MFDVSTRACEGVLRLAREAWTEWKLARLGQGVRPGPVALPGISHPDIALEYDTLDEKVREWTINLMLQRVLQFRENRADFEALLRAGRGEAELDGPTIERISIGLHNGWWGLRRMLGRAKLGEARHVGDHPWDELDDPAQNNDRTLVPGLAKLFAAAADSEDQELKDVIAYIRSGR